MAFSEYLAQLPRETGRIAKRDSPKSCQCAERSRCCLTVGQMFWALDHLFFANGDVLCVSSPPTCLLDGPQDSKLFSINVRTQRGFQPVLGRSNEDAFVVKCVRGRSDDNAGRVRTENRRRRRFREDSAWVQGLTLEHIPVIEPARQNLDEDLA